MRFAAQSKALTLTHHLETWDGRNVGNQAQELTIPSGKDPATWEPPEVCYALHSGFLLRE